MRRLLLLSLMCATLAGAYAAAPFYAAWAIREAIIHGDKAYLQEKVDWASLKETLKPSIARMALNLPEFEGEDAPKPTMWQRIKSTLGKGMVDRIVDKYVTPEGLPQLFSYRKAYRDKVATAPPPDESGMPLRERFAKFWARVKRAEFKSATRFELDVIDKNVPDRLSMGVLELRGFSWKLTELRVKSLKASEAVATREPDGGDPQER